MKKNYKKLINLPGLIAAALLFSAPQVEAQTTLTYTYTGAMESFTVPPCVASVTLVAAGARGVGTTAPYLFLPGKGGFAQGVLSVTPGQVLNIFVGGTNGYNGGGSGLQNANGGGASDVRVGGTAFTDRVIVAGGGGGAGGDSWQCTDITRTGDGGGGTAVGANFVGGAGGAGYTSGTGCGTHGANLGGTGGTGTHGGGGGGGGLTTGGAGAASSVGTAGTGSLGLGGNASIAGSCAGNGTGGGGGGYYGGGGASGNNCGAGRGGGGSSWTGTLANPSFTAGTNNGNGFVSVTYDFGVPSLTITSSTSSNVCVGTTMTLTASGAATYTWSNGSNATSIVVTPTSNVTYSVASQGTAACPAYGLFPTTMIALPVVTATASPNYIICANVPVTLTGGGADSYNWSGGVTNGVPFPATSTTIYTVTGINMITGCVNTNTILVPVYVSTVAISAATTICSGATANLSASGALTYTWSNGNQLASINVSPSSTTVYTVNVTTADFCFASNTTTVTVNPSPTVSANASDADICIGESVVLTASGATNYSWNTSATTNTISVSPTSSTVYTVTGTTNNCSNSGTVSVKVNVCVGIGELSNPGNDLISIYPNPSTGEFNVMSETTLNLSVVNQLGQVVKHIQLTKENNYKAKVTGLSAGVYFVTGSHGDMQVNYKIVVNN